MASDRHLLLTSLWAGSNNTSGLALGNRWKIEKTMRLNLGRRLCWCATCLQSKVKVHKTHKSSLLRKRSEFTLRPRCVNSCTVRRKSVFRLLHLGHSTNTVAANYGSGYALEVMREHMEKVWQ